MAKRNGKAAFEQIPEVPAGAISIGEGVLNWCRFERVSDRYGSVTIRESADDPAVTNIDAVAGQRGRLIAQVVDARASSHIGDLFRGFRPSKPTNGDVPVLGTGTIRRGVASETEGSIDAIVVEPDDGRKTDWLNPEALYRCHESRVRILWLPAEA